MTIGADSELLGRIIKKRVRESQSLEDSVVLEVLHPHWEKIGEKSRNAEGSHEKVKFALEHFFEAAMNASIPAKARRQAWDSTSAILERIRKACAANKEPSSSKRSTQNSQPSNVPTNNRTSLDTTQGLQSRRSDQAVTPAANRQPVQQAAAEAVQENHANQTQTDSKHNRDTNISGDGKGNSLNNTRGGEKRVDKSTAGDKRDIAPETKQTNGRAPPTYERYSKVVGTGLNNSREKNGLSSNRNEHSTADKQDAPTFAKNHRREDLARDRKRIGISNRKRESQLVKRMILTYQPKHSIVVQFQADKKQSHRTYLYSNSLIERPTMSTIRLSLKEPTAKQVDDICRRFSKFDPFFDFVGSRWVGTTVAPDHEDPVIRSAASIMYDLSHFSLNSMKGRIAAHRLQNSPPSNEWKNGEYGLFLKMIPVKPSLKNRADGHLWPKGTFVQVNGVPMTIDQRSQQPHAVKQWKGRCGILDLTRLANFSGKLKVEIACMDEEVFMYTLGFVRHESVDSIYDTLLSNHRLLPFIQYDAAVQLAKEKANSELVVLADDDEPGGVSQSGKFAFSLMCPISRQLMTVPVRGRECKHFQCFDLKTYLQSNYREGFGRWRCAACERFAAWDSLLICGLTVAARERFKEDASPSRDRVEFSADGTFVLLPEKRPRHSGNKRAADAKKVSGQPKKASIEIIEVIED